MTGEVDGASAPQLRRRLTLPLLTLYGVGTTVGAGIYVLVGKVGGEAGLFAPLSFVLAGILAGLSGCSFAELSSRFPRSAGEALYVRQGLRSVSLSTGVGLLVVLGATISAATITHGFVGYLVDVIAIEPWLAKLLILALLGTIAAWGILEAVSIAAILTIVEIGGLLLLLWAGRGTLVGLPAALDELTFDHDSGIGLLSGAILAFFAFIGFENTVNVAEEVRDARRTLPRAIFLTLVITTTLYIAVALVAALGAPATELARSDAPLVFLYERFTGEPATLLSAIALVAVVNGALIQIVMAARVLYGLSQHGQAPRVFGKVSVRTQTPIVATLCITVLVAVATLLFPIVTLARFTSLVILVVFLLVNLALVAMKQRDRAPKQDGLSFPLWVPAAGAATSAFLAVFETASLLGLT